MTGFFPPAPSGLYYVDVTIDYPVARTYYCTSSVRLRLPSVLLGFSHRGLEQPFTAFTSLIHPRASPLRHRLRIASHTEMATFDNLQACKHKFFLRVSRGCSFFGNLLLATLIY
eukprot:Gb_34629 [translate_table: standard]